jgi:hypothetical protein
MKGITTFDVEEPSPKKEYKSKIKSAKRQFAKDLQKDPDYIEHLEKSKGYGSVNATSSSKLRTCKHIWK